MESMHAAEIEDKGAIVLKHSGLLDGEHIQSLVEAAESRLTEQGISRGVVKRCFNVLIEGLQNACFHSSEGSKEVPYHLSIAHLDESVSITIMNRTEVESLSKVTRYIDQLNAMEQDELKAYYRERMHSGTMSSKGGAGLGLITMVMRSSEGIDWSEHPVSAEQRILVQRLSVS